MTHDIAHLLVTEAEIRLRAGLFIDPDFVHKLEKIELDEDLPAELRLRAASANKEHGHG